MNTFESWWIGDRVKIISSGEMGYYEGMVSSKVVKIRITSGAFKEAPITDLQNIGDEKIEVELKFEPEIVPKNKQAKTRFSDTLIDLHYDELQKYLTHDNGSILEFQMASCESFILRAIQTNSSPVHIIYGKGQGILKQVIANLLHDYQSEINLISWHPNKASVDVWFK